MDKNVKIGVLNDQSSLYADIAGPGSTLAAQMAVEDSGLPAKGWKIDVIAADHQNKPDVGTNIARQWIDVEKVDVIADVPNSSVALAINNLVKEKNRVFINSGAATSDLTNAQCSPNTVHWTYDTYMLANGTGQALVKAGGDTWFFLTADYAFGARARARHRGGRHGEWRQGGRRRQASAEHVGLLVLPAAGAGVEGEDRRPCQRRRRHHQLDQAGGRIRHRRGRPEAGWRCLLFITDVNALGLETAQGLNFTETFYWDLNDQTRAFSKKFSERMKNKAPPTMVQAGVYSGLLHYLKALEALGGNPHDGVKVVAKMKEIPTDDPLFGKGTIRADGRKIHPAYLFEVKKPSESKGPWDFYKLVGTIPGDEAFTPVWKEAPVRC